MSQQLSSSLTRSLQDLCQQENSPLFAALLSAFKVLLFRYTGQHDLVVGSLMNCCDLADRAPSLPSCTHTVALRTDLSGDPTFEDFLTRVHATVSAASAHEGISLERVAQALQREPLGDRGGLFSVAFSFQGRSASSCEPLCLKITRSPMGSALAECDLALAVEERPDRLALSLEYNADLFDEATIQRMAGHYQRLLEAIVARPAECIAELPLMTDAERQQVLVEWNDTRTEYPADKCIHELFEEQAARTPEAAALVWSDGEMSYGELNARANRLAHYLRELGVDRETPVAVCVERSWQMVAGLLAILKAGGAYAPLDPDYPSERLAFMLADTHAPVLLATRTATIRIESYDGRIVLLDREPEWFARYSEANLPRGSQATDLAYVMYTSGSTGTPKGAAIVHRGVVRLVKGTDYVRLDADEVFLQFAPLSFDASTFEIWAPLLNGARLVLFPPGLPTLEELGQVIRNCGVTTLWLTAGLFHQLVDHRVDDLAGLRQLLAGGDALSPTHVVKALRHLPNCLVINGYGPTENTTFTCCHSLTAAEEVGERVSIGRPIANTQVYVLDGNGHPVPIGVPGELYAAGDGVARGYWRRPDLTGQVFLPNPFAADPAARLYRTGDKVRRASMERSISWGDWTNR